MSDDHKPRLSMSDDGQYVYIGFTDTQDTVLMLSSEPGGAGHRDIARTREWVAAVRTAIGDDEADDEVK